MSTGESGHVFRVAAEKLVIVHRTTAAACYTDIAVMVLTFADAPQEGRSTDSSPFNRTIWYISQDWNRWITKRWVRSFC